MYDAIIIGAGPAGLSLASELSQKHKILVVEKGKIGVTEKSWGSGLDVMKKLNLEKCIVNKNISQLIFKHYLGSTWLFEDDYCQLDEKKLLNEFVKRCNKKNTEFLEHTYIDKVNSKNNKIKIKIGNKEISTRLLIDCSGAFSPIVKKYDLIDSYSSYPILGYTLKDVKVDPHLFIWEIMKTPGYHEIMIGGIMPYSSRKAQVHVFPYLWNKTCNYSFLQKYLKDYLTYYPGLNSGKLVTKTFGTIKMGSLKKNSLDNVFFYGAAGLWTPRFAGTGFNMILFTFQEVASKLSKLIVSNDLSEKKLSKIKNSILEPKMVHFLKCLEKIVFSIRDNPDKMNEFLNMVGKSDPQFGKYLLRSEFNLNSLKKSWDNIHKFFSVREILKILPKKDIMYLLELEMDLIEDTLIEKYKKILTK
jgi:flavin-dependent dehydrogenase